MQASAGTRDARGKVHPEVEVVNQLGFIESIASLASNPTAVKTKALKIDETSVAAELSVPIFRLRLAAPSLSRLKAILI